MSQQIDWPGIRAAAIAVGVREAARRAASDLSDIERNRFVKRVLKRSEREGWITQKQSAMSQPLTVEQSKPLSSKVVTGSEAITASLADDARETKISLSKGVRKGAKHVEMMTGEQVFSKAKNVKEIVGAASQLHGWDQQSGSAGMLNLNILMGQAVIVQGNLES